jgi:hypothetical protein
MRRLLACLVVAAPIPTPIGFGPRYHLPPTSRAVAHADAVGRFSCRRGEAPRELAHVELFARKLVLLLPAGIGMAPPLVWDGAEVTGARCSYGVRTTGPTGVIEYVSGLRPTLGDVFDVWGQPLSSRGFAGFHGAVAAWVGGKRWRGDVRSIPLRHHAEIVVEVGGYIPPHRFFLFPR